MLFLESCDVPVIESSTQIIALFLHVCDYPFLAFFTLFLALCLNIGNTYDLAFFTCHIGVSLVGDLRYFGLILTILDYNLFLQWFDLLLMLFDYGCDSLLVCFLGACNTLVSKSSRHYLTLFLQVRKTPCLTLFTLILALFLNNRNSPNLALLTFFLLLLILFRIQRKNLVFQFQFEYLTIIQLDTTFLQCLVEHGNSLLFFE